MAHPSCMLFDIAPGYCHYFLICFALRQQMFNVPFTDGFFRFFRFSRTFHVQFSIV